MREIIKINDTLWTLHFSSIRSYSMAKLIFYLFNAKYDFFYRKDLESPLIFVLFLMGKYMRGHPISVYRSISSILNLTNKLVSGAPSKSSQVTALSEVLNYLNLCSSLSMRACGSSEVEVGTRQEAGQPWSSYAE